jgi:membrane protein DedA with SNARE-associated domain
MDPHLTALLSFIVLYGYFVILPVAILEGPIITVIAAFLAAQGYFNIYAVFAIVVIGDLLGDLLYYGIGRFGTKLFNTKFGKRFGLDTKHLALIEKHYATHSGKTLIIGKWTHSLGLVTLTGAGAAKMPVGRFMWYSLLGTIPKSLVFLLLGYYTGYAYQKINMYFNDAAYIMGAVIVLAIAIYFFIQWRKSHKTK